MFLYMNKKQEKKCFIFLVSDTEKSQTPKQIHLWSHFIFLFTFNMTQTLIIAENETNYKA